MREQLRASKATLGQTAQDVYRMQAAPLPSKAQAAPETEEDGMRAEALRRLKVRQQYKTQPVQTPDSLSTQSKLPAPTESTSSDKPRISK